MQYLKEKTSEKIFRKFNYVFLAIFGFTTLYPFWYFIVLSFNDGQDAMRGGIYLWPRLFTLDNYIKAFENQLIVSSFQISVFRTVIGTAISLLLTSTLAFALVKRDLPGRSLIIMYFFFTTLFSGGLIPVYILYRNLGLTKSVWIYIFPFLYNFFNMIIMRTYFDAIPKSISESAIVEGCNDIQLYAKIFMPLAVPSLATIALFFGVMHWNDWFTGSIFINDRSLIPAASLLQQIITEASFESSRNIDKINEIMEGQKSNTSPEALRMTFLVITTVPILCVYPFLQRYFVSGVMVGSVKG